MDNSWRGNGVPMVPPHRMSRLLRASERDSANISGIDENDPQTWYAGGNKAGGNSDIVLKMDEKQLSDFLSGRSQMSANRLAGIASEKRDKEPENAKEAQDVGLKIF